MAESQKNHYEALQFAFLLAQLAKTKFNGCSAGDWLNLKEKYFSFLNSSPGSLTHERRDRFIEKITSETLIEIGKTFRDEMQRARESGQYDTASPRAGRFLASAPTPDSSFSRVMVLGYDLESARAALWDHLCGSGILRSQIWLCSQCGELTLLPKKPQKGKKYYCSLRCARRSAYKSSPKGKKAAARKARRERAQRAAGIAPKGKTTSIPHASI